MTDSNQQSGLSKEQIDSVIALYTAGQYQEAINQIKILNQSYPNTPFLFNLIGACYKSLGQLEGSAKMFETAVNLKPDYAEAHKNLGITLKDLGQLDAAVGSLSKAIAIDPSYVDAHYNLAITFKDLNQLDAAVKSYQKVIEINPNFAQAYNNLGNLMKDLGQADVAIKNYQKAIEINPSFAHAYNNLGNAFKDLGQLKEAVTNYQKAIEKNPDFSEAHNNLGNAFKDLYKFDDAVKSYQRAVEINPKFAAAYYNLGTVFKKINQKEKLLTLFENAYLLDPDLDFILGDLLTARMQFCNWSEFTDLLKNLQKKITENKKVVDPFNLLGLIDDTALQKKAAQIFSDYHNLKKNTLYKIKPYAKKSKIRIGYFSADFHNHATMHLMAEFFELHDKELFEIFAFSFGPEKIDNWRERVISSFDDFIDVRDKTDQEVSLMSKKLEIDIAVDLKGFTKDCRPNIFAEFCAPVQVSYLGYPGTIGAEHIHYLIADQTLIPEDSQNLYSEKIVYMPNTYQVNMATRDVSVVSL